MEEKDTEIWKDIKDYEEHYQVSNFGNVKSLYFKNIHGIVKKEKVLKINYDKVGYLIVRLSKNSKLHTKTIHRIVAETFIDNPKLKKIQKN